MPLDANLAAPSAADICEPGDAGAISVPEERSAVCLPPADIARAAAARFSTALALFHGCAPC